MIGSGGHAHVALEGGPVGDRDVEGDDDRHPDSHGLTVEGCHRRVGLLVEGQRLRGEAGACAQLQRHNFSRTNRLVAGKGYPQTVHCVLYMFRQVNILNNRSQKVTLFTVAELLVVRLIVQAYPFVRLYELIILIKRGMMITQQFRCSV